MSAGEYGFFLGAMPGIAYTLWNLARARKVLNEANAIIRAHGEILDLDAVPSLQFDYLFRPAHLMCPNDGEGMRQVKTLLLSERPGFLRRQVVGGLFVVLGAFAGVGIALGLAPGP